MANYDSVKLNVMFPSKNLTLIHGCENYVNNTCNLYFNDKDQTLSFSFKMNPTYDSIKAKIADRTRTLEEDTTEFNVLEDSLKFSLSKSDKVTNELNISIPKITQITRGEIKLTILSPMFNATDLIFNIDIMCPKKQGDNPCQNGGECKDKTIECDCTKTEYFFGKFCQFSCQPNTIVVTSKSSFRNLTHHKYLGIYNQTIGQKPLQYKNIKYNTTITLENDHGNQRVKFNKNIELPRNSSVIYGGYFVDDNTVFGDDLIIEIHNETLKYRRGYLDDSSVEQEEIMHYSEEKECCTANEERCIEEAWTCDWLNDCLGDTDEEIFMCHAKDKCCLEGLFFNTYLQSDSRLKDL